MSKYTCTEKLLHKLTLGNPRVRELTYDFEKIFIQTDKISSEAVYVLGLARAGTTALMQELHDSKIFASLTYDDMPFVLAPNLWKKITKLNNKKRISKERAHGDGVFVNFDSPEALEEVFWRTACNDQYINKNSLDSHLCDDEIISELNRYQNLVCKKYNKDRYLAKNNNTLLRIASLAPKQPQSKFLILFRDPFFHANSLLKQHNRFKKSDQFTNFYMEFLVHHEFGNDLRPFNFNRDMPVLGNPSDIQYWINYWAYVYDYLLEVIEENSKNIIPICYERLCSEPEYWHQICNKLKIPISTTSFRSNNINENPETRELDLKHAENVYQRLLQLSNLENNQNTI
jgi:hypothetical protein